MSSTSWFIVEPYDDGDKDQVDKIVDYEGNRELVKGDIKQCKDLSPKPDPEKGWTDSLAASLASRFKCLRGCAEC